MKEYTVIAKRSSFARYANFSERNLFSRQNFVQQGMIDHPRPSESQ
jgi:hypothetical protein